MRVSLGEEAEDVERGAATSIELVGTAATMNQAVRCLGVLGRAAIVALSREALSFLPYTELINKEAPDAQAKLDGFKPSSSARLIGLNA